MKCTFCRKKVSFSEVRYVENKPFHPACYNKLLKLREKAKKEEENRRKQLNLGVWVFGA